MGAEGVKLKWERREGMCHGISMPGNQETVMPITPLKSPLDYQETTSGIERKEATDGSV